MTEISFHFNVADRTDYTCRLVRKASRSGAAIVMAGPRPVLGRFDRALWTFDELEFIPHAIGPGPAKGTRARQVWLLEDATQTDVHEVLINLGDVPPAGFESFARLVEIVSTDDADRASARDRWKHYASRGYRITRHEAGPGASTDE